VARHFFTSDYYLSGNLKAKVYKNNPRSIEALQNEITRVIHSITVDELQRVSRNLFIRCEACLQAEGSHFQHVINHGKFVLSFLLCSYKCVHVEKLMGGESAKRLHSRYRGTAQQCQGGVASVLRWCDSRHFAAVARL
jgi:hypothetical protein